MSLPNAQELIRKIAATYEKPKPHKISKQIVRVVKTSTLRPLKNANVDTHTHTRTRN